MTTTIPSRYDQLQSILEALDAAKIPYFQGVSMVGNTEEPRKGQDEVKGRFFPCLFDADGCIIPGTVIAENLHEIGYVAVSHTKSHTAYEAVRRIFPLVAIDVKARKEQARAQAKKKMQRQLDREMMKIDLEAEAVDIAREEGITVEEALERLADEAEARAEAKAAK